MSAEERIEYVRWRNNSNNFIFSFKHMNLLLLKLLHFYSIIMIMQDFNENKRICRKSLG